LTNASNGTLGSLRPAGYDASNLSIRCILATNVPVRAPDAAGTAFATHRP
jgi:hypothetical protein